MMIPKSSAKPVFFDAGKYRSNNTTIT